MSVLLYCFQSREGIMDIFENYTGGRLTVHGVRIGGVPFDLDGKVTEMIRRSLVEIPEKLKDIEGLLNENRIWEHRTRGIGVISPEDAFALGLTGPALRATGFAWDVRRDIPYSSYEDFDFEVPVLRSGDAYGRYLVRMEEMRQSIRIIGQALERLPPGEFQVRVPRLLKIPPGEVFHTIEAPKGELGFYIKSNGTEKPERVKMKSPSFINLQSLELMCKGNLFSDIVGILGSLDIVLGEIDK
jgi:NADH-quinone oxidoreductase subunit D